VSRPSTALLLWGQVRHQNRLFWRTPIAAFFTIVFPLMFLVVFNLLFPDDGVTGMSTAQFYAPALAVFGAVSATYTNLAIGTSIARDEGVLKRVRGTPLPPWIYIAGRIGSASYVAVLSAGLMLAIGVVAYDLEVYAVAVPAAVVTFLAGIACWAALGMLLAAVAPSGDSAPALANATLLPLAFISDVFIPPSDAAPAWIGTVAGVFPLKPFAAAFGDAFDPAEVAAHGAWTGQFQWGAIALMTVWCVVAVVLALRRFRWEPRPGGRSRRRRRSVAA